MIEFTILFVENGELLGCNCKGKCPATALNAFNNGDIYNITKYDQSDLQNQIMKVIAL